MMRRGPAERISKFLSSQKGDTVCQEEERGNHGMVICTKVE
jgi:hypothetical protein